LHPKLTLPIVFLVLGCLHAGISHAQDSASLYDKAFQLPDKIFGGIARSTDKMQQRLQRSTTKYFHALGKKENKLRKKLAKKDPAAAQRLFGDVRHRYDSLQQLAVSPATKMPNAYNARLDSMTTAFQFLQKGGAGAPTAAVQQKMTAALKNYGGVQNSLNQTQFLQQQITARQQYLKSQLGSFGMVKELKQFQQQAYYYRAQVDEYKKMFEQPDKMEKALLKAATKLPAFKNFFAKNSQLGRLFRLPGGDAQPVAAIPGLQTRAMVMDNLDQRLGTGPNANAALSSGIRSAQDGLNNAKKKLSQLGNAGKDIDQRNFQPNEQKTKTFLQRLEFGTNLQSTKSNTFLPVTTDLGLSVGYQFSKKAVAGIGASYKLGWGKDIKHLSLSHEGVGLRTFADFKFKGSIWLTGGGEMNYRAHFDDFAQLKDRSDWQKSALAGLSKKYQINKKMKGNFRLLYDFLYRRNVPQTPPVVFRMGYNF
jgi:hypothetical protein